MAFHNYMRIITNSIMSSDRQITVLQKSMHNHICNYRFSNDSLFYEPKPTVFNKKATLHKVITEQKGLCIELNYAYSCVLKSLNIRNHFVRCLWPQYPIYHNALITRLDNGERYYVDVGCGDFFVEPIRIPKITDGIFQIERFKVFDEPVTFGWLNRNFVSAHHLTCTDFPLARKLIERIYDPITGAYRDYNA